MGLLYAGGLTYQMVTTTAWAPLLGWEGPPSGGDGTPSVTRDPRGPPSGIERGRIDARSLSHYYLSAWQVPMAIPTTSTCEDGPAAMRVSFC